MLSQREEKKDTRGKNMDKCEETKKKWGKIWSNDLLGEKIWKKERGRRKGRRGKGRKRRKRKGKKGKKVKYLNKEKPYMYRYLGTWGKNMDKSGQNLKRD